MRQQPVREFHANLEPLLAFMERRRLISTIIGTGGTTVKSLAVEAKDSVGQNREVGLSGKGTKYRPNDDLTITFTYRNANSVRDVASCDAASGV